MIPSSVRTIASGINDAGQIVGEFYTTPAHGFLATPVGGSTGKQSQQKLIMKKIADCRLIVSKRRRVHEPRVRGSMTRCSAQ
jgi:hypothetical protein